jgi:hypothetical protein
MDNQHRKISGYRELTEAEIAAMNALKAKGAELGAILDEVKEMPGIDQRALAIARTELQTGLMWAVRAVARPQGF